jgi:hypothetical protein
VATERAGAGVHVPAEIEAKRFAAVMSTGTLLSAAVVLPSCPWELLPQQ